MRKYQKHKRPCSPYDRFSKAEISTTRHCYYDFCCYSNILPINFLSWSVCIQLQPIFCSTSSNLQAIGASISSVDSRPSTSQESTSQECARQECASQESASQECATPTAVPTPPHHTTPDTGGSGSTKEEAKA